jgi:cytosolic carboxypeptidase protein 2/3
VRYFYELSFTHTFTATEDKVFFAYCFPYTFSKLQSFLKELTSPKLDHLMESVLCRSLSGVDVPMLTVTSRLRSDPGGFNVIKQCDFNYDNEIELGLPPNKRKQYVIVTGRVHPGETPGSWMMQGFLKHITGNSRAAVELRKRYIFKIVPMINVDGVIVGNYRTSLSGNDLNRRYLEPNRKLHPEVAIIKNLMNDLVTGKYKCNWGKGVDSDVPEFKEEDIHAFIDMHGHSRKKNVFIYGP